MTVHVMFNGRIEKNIKNFKSFFLFVFQNKEKKVTIETVCETSKLRK